MRTLILSDLHLGPNETVPIYVGGAVLPALIIKHTDEPLRLVLNGDTFDLLLDDTPLHFDPDAAARRLVSCVGSRDALPLMTAVATVLSRGGEVVIRAGNHDLELAIPAVQECFRDVVRSMGCPVTKLEFARDDAPQVFDVGERRVLVTHGEHDDAFNKWSRANLLHDGSPNLEFRFPAGSRLVKDVLNPLRSEMRFLDLLKPDFHGAVLSAIAVRPLETLSILRRSSTFEILAQALESSAMASTLSEVEVRGPFDVLLAEANLDEGEAEELLLYLDESACLGDDGGIFKRAIDKLGRTALSVYARLQRWATGSRAAEFFDASPSPDEWKDAQRLASEYGADVVVAGHTHARRYGVEHGVTYVNTGTWIGLMRPPSEGAPASEWTTFLESLRRDPMLRESSHVHGLGGACLIEPATGAVTLLREDFAPDASWFDRGTG